MSRGSRHRIWLHLSRVCGQAVLSLHGRGSALSAGVREQKPLLILHMGHSGGLHFSSLKNCLPLLPPLDIGWPPTPVAAPETDPPVGDAFTGDD